MAEASESELCTSAKVYLEDTDAQGIVYHANYLKYFERARTDWLEANGVGLETAQSMGFRFVVHAMKIEFHRPAKLGDRLEIRTKVRRASPFRLVFEQRALDASDAEPRTSASVDVACIDDEGELAEISEELVRLD